MIEGKVAAAAVAAGGIDAADVERVAKSSAALIWEFAKAGTAEGATVAAVMLQLGLPEQLGTAFAEVMCIIYLIGSVFLLINSGFLEQLYQRQRRVLQGKKDALSLPGYRYHHLCWRLDVEVCRV
jgi:hypothetical protein